MLTRAQAKCFSLRVVKELSLHKGFGYPPKKNEVYKVLATPSHRSLKYSKTCISR